MRGLGFLLMIIGISAADSESLIIPAALVALAMVLITKGNKKKWEKH